jgi:hypothetical protein
MKPSNKLKEIEELVEDHWFYENPNTSDVECEINWLIDRVKKLTNALEELKRGAENCIVGEEENIPMDPEMVLEDINKALEQE